MQYFMGDIKYIWDFSPHARSWGGRHDVLRAANENHTVLEKMTEEDFDIPTDGWHWKQRKEVSQEFVRKLTKCFDPLCRRLRQINGGNEGVMADINAFLLFQMRTFQHAGQRRKGPARLLASTVLKEQKRRH